MRRPVRAAACGAVVLAFGACASSGPPRDLEAPDLFQWAHDQFDAGEYADAAEGFLAYMIRDPLSPLADSAQFLAAEGHLRAGRELDAVEEFRRMASGRPNSPLADDAQLGLCRAYLAASPRVSLSQEFTRRALDECARLLQFFPATDFRDEAERLMAEARAKLARKNYEIGRFYQDNRRVPESAIVYFEIALSEGPAADFLPDLLLRLYQAYRGVGFETEATTIRERLLSEFPDSEEAREVTGAGSPAGNDPPPG